MATFGIPQLWPELQAIPVVFPVIYDNGNENDCFILWHVTLHMNDGKAERKCQQKDEWKFRHELNSRTLLSNRRKVSENCALRS